MFTRADNDNILGKNVQSKNAERFLYFDKLKYTLRFIEKPHIFIDN